MRVLPILFNGDMVRAILDGHKTVTRRAVKPQPDWFDCGICGDRNTPMKAVNMKDCELKPPYQPGDILYVRETWDNLPVNPDGTYCGYDRYYFRAGGDLRPEGWRGKWKSPLHMRRTAARIWIRVTEVRVERLQVMSYKDFLKEGITVDIKGVGVQDIANQKFRKLWDSTIKKSNIGIYSWEANPWVWVMEFERCEKPEPCIIAGLEPIEEKRPCIGYGVSYTDDEPCEMCKGCEKRSGYGDTQ